MANRIHASNSMRSLAHALVDPAQLGLLSLVLVPLCLVCALYRLRVRNRVLNFSLLWAGCYAAYMTLVHYTPPRYFMAELVPYAVWIALALRESMRHRVQILLAAVACAVLAVDAARIVQYLTHPKYSLVGAANSVRDVLAHDGRPGAIVMGDFANTFSLISGVRSVNAEHGGMPFSWRVEHFRPGYYVATPGGNPQAEELNRRYRLQEVAHYVVLDGVKILLYRLEPPSTSH